MAITFVPSLVLLVYYYNFNLALKSRHFYGEILSTNSLIREVEKMLAPYHNIKY